MYKKNIKTLISIILCLSCLCTFAISSFATTNDLQANLQTEKISVLQDDNNARRVEVTDIDGHKAVAILNKITGQLTITENGENVYSNNTKSDVKFEKKAKELQGLNKNTLRINQKNNVLLTNKKLNESSTYSINPKTAAYTTNSNWTCIDSNIDMFWGYYYDLYQSQDQTVYLWDVWNGADSSMKTIWEDSTNYGNLTSFANSVDSMLNNEYSFIIAMVISVTSAMLTFIYGGSALTKAAFTAGIAAFGIAGIAANSAYNISQSIRLANRYYARIY